MSKIKSYYWDSIENYDNTSKTCLNTPRTDLNTKVGTTLPESKIIASKASNRFSSNLHTAYKDYNEIHG